MTSIATLTHGAITFTDTSPIFLIAADIYWMYTLYQMLITVVIVIEVTQILTRKLEYVTKMLLLIFQSPYNGSNVEALTVCNWMVQAILANSAGNTLLFDSMPFVLGLSISSIAMVLYCDRVEASSKDLIKQCYLLQPDVNDPLLMKELLNLTEFIKDLRPKMQVSGYFRINKRIVPVMISTLTTYLIIVIQFNKS
ncbi:uncharacterized protein [Diabrotica undecimpunctata]|uniref:uncharacterized protein n=1 Tax=Diabrotica undecimpunctata TaxID=50387 RepID=UPI003B641354